MNVLVVEDDESVARFLGQALTESGYVVERVNDGLTGLDRGRSLAYDLILMDVMLPGMNGLEVCRRLRSANISTPILIITAKDTLQDRVDGLDSGADDYIVKPFQVAELLARARALLRRAVSAPTVLRVADLTLDPASRRALRSGEPLRQLSATEYSLLEYLMRNVDRVLTRAMILEHVWQFDFGGNDNVLDVYISYLRNKIDKGRRPTLIHTVRGVGFRLGVEDGG